MGQKTWLRYTDVAFNGIIAMGTILLALSDQSIGPLVISGDAVQWTRLALLLIIFLSACFLVWRALRRPNVDDRVRGLESQIEELSRDVGYTKAHLRSVHFTASELHGRDEWSDQLGDDTNPHHEKLREEFSDYDYMSDAPSGFMPGGSVTMGGPND